NQVQELAKNNLATPLNNLSANIRLAVNNLQEVTNSFNVLVGKQRECIFARLDLFVAGVQTVATGIRLLGFKVVSVDSPRLLNFVFDEQLTPNIVPKTGGQALVKGVLVWTEPDLPPTVKIQTADKTVLGQPQAQHGGGENEFRISVQPSLLASHSGECLY